jgi:hypothetical protein
MAAVVPGTGKKRKGLSSAVVVIVILGVALGAGAWMLYRRRSSASSGAAAPPASAATDQTGQISTLQAEVADLQGRLAQSGGDEGPGDTDTDTDGGSTAKKPGMPTHVSGSATSATSIRLTWSKVTGATEYKASATAGGKTAGTTQTVKGTSATIPGLKPGTSYTCHVSAGNAAGWSAATNGPVVRTPARTVGHKPPATSGGDGESEAA